MPDAIIPDPIIIAVIGVAVLLGTVVQSSVGLGVGLVAAPVAALLDPSLMPGGMLIVTAATPLLTLPGEWRRADWRGIGWGMLGRLAGTVAGVWVVSALSVRALGLAVGAMVLVGVAASVWAVRIRVTPATVASAGVISGITGTATSIGGPPMALVYQHEPGPTVRATLGVYFLLGIAASLAALAIGGQLHLREVVAGVSLLPFMVAGFLLGRPIRRIVDAGSMRVMLLVVVSVSGAVLIARSLF
nr:sulfite exporter TauE/SafE family protein [Murinocardiopsis flavida]